MRWRSARLACQLTISLAIGMLAAPAILPPSIPATAPVAEASGVLSSATLGFACPAQSPHAILYSILAGSPPFIAPGTIDFGGGALTVIPNASRTAVDWSLSGTSIFGAVDAVVVWGVDPANGTSDGLANTYHYNPEATRGRGLTDNNPMHRITHLYICGDLDVPVLGVISGQVWADLDGDREFVLDSAIEKPLPGWPVRILTGSCSARGGLAPVPGNPALTSPTGDYSWAVPAGTYCIEELQQQGYIQSAPLAGLPSLNFGVSSAFADFGAFAAPVGNRWEIVVSGLGFGDITGLNFGNQPRTATPR